PRYLCNDIKKMLLSDSKAITLTVEKISDDAPHNYRLLCKLSGTLHPSCQSTLILQDEFEAIE
ncbi:restriction endonuclease, partial [Salmonella enterica subsp. enterica serovar Muenchen]